MQLGQFLSHLGAEGGGGSRRRILEAAWEVLGAEGVSSTRVEDLLQAAGVSRRTFYKHFGSKEAVLTALYALVTQELLFRAVSSAAAESEPLEALEAVLDSYLEVHVSNHAMVRVLVEEAVRSESPLAPLRMRLREQLVESMVGVLARVTGRRLDPLVGTALVSMLEGLSLELLREGAPSEADVGRTRAVILGVIEVIRGGVEVLPQVSG